MHLLLLLLALCGLNALFLAGGWLSSAPIAQPSSWAVVVDPGSRQSVRQPSIEETTTLSLHAVLKQLIASSPTTSPSPSTSTTTSSSSSSSSSSSRLGMHAPAEDITLSSLDIDACRPHEAVVWDDWRACVIEHALADRGISFEAFIVTQGPQLPWALHSDHTAVLLEFRPWAAAMRFAINNAMHNLPVHWRVQVVGGLAICRLAQQLFPNEVAAGKIIVTDLGLGDYMRQDLISRVMTDLDLLYSKLLGDTWLFFQVHMGV